MKHATAFGLLLALAALSWTGPVEGKAAAAGRQPRTAVTCDWPIGVFENARTLLRRFGRQARMADIARGGGETERGVVLYANDPRRRIEVLFWDNTDYSPKSVRFSGAGAPWTVWGIRIGDSMESVRRRNGRAFTLQQFGSDQGGTLESPQGGRLEPDEERLDCRPAMVFSPSADVPTPKSLVGDGDLSSDHPDMASAKARVAVLGIEFPPPTDY